MNWICPKLLDSRELRLHSQNQLILGMKKLQKKQVEGFTINERPQRYFSEEARRSIVIEVENGLSKSEAARKYGVSESSIYVWIAKYSRFYQKQLRQVVEHESDSLRLKRRELELEQVYALLGREQARSLYLESVIEQAGESLGMDLKKNFAVPHSPFCRNKKTNMA
jgi:transposase-like protein